MARIVFDTSVWIAYQPTELPNNFLMSAVVLQELTAGATDSTNLKKWETAYRLHEKESTLLVPTGEDRWLAGKVLNALLRGLKSKAGWAVAQIGRRRKNSESFVTY